MSEATLSVEDPLEEPTIGEGETPEVWDETLLNEQVHPNYQGITLFVHTTKPDNPNSGYVKLFSKGNNLYILDSAGNEVLVESANTLAFDVIANRPAAGSSPRLFYATDENKLYYDNGVSWDEQAVPSHTHTESEITDIGTHTHDGRYYTEDEVDTLLTGKSDTGHNHDATYAPIAKGVTNGDAHDHSGGDGGQIDHGSMAGLDDNDHGAIYYTELEVDTLLSGKSATGHTHNGTEISLDTTNFDNNLSVADDTVQKAMETLDDMVASGEGGSGVKVARWFVPGRLATGSNVAGVYIASAGETIQKILIYCGTPGSASSTIVDLNKNGTTLYTTQGNRPTLAYDDADQVATATDPDVTSLASGDVVTLDIDQVATGAEDLTVVMLLNSTGNAITVEEEDGTPTVEATEINFPNGSLTDNGGGSVSVSFYTEGEVDALLAALGNLNLGAILTTNGTYKGVYFTGTVDTNSVGFGAVLAQAADFHFDDADADAIANATGLVMALETSTGSKKLLVMGQVCNTSWNWSAGFVYLSTTAGGLTQSAPTGEDDVVIILGIALSADTILFAPGMFSYLEHTA